MRQELNCTRNGVQVIATLVIMVAILLMPVHSALAAAPIATWLDDQPGLYAPIQGITLEQQIADGLDPNDPDSIDRDSWIFEAIDWGNEGHIQPGNHTWRIVESALPSGAGALCGGNEGQTGEANPCANSTRRYETTMKGSPDVVGMNTDRDWVFSFYIKNEYVDSVGSDKLFETASVSKADGPPGGDMMAITGRGVGGGSIAADGTEHVYKLTHGACSAPGQCENKTVDIDTPLNDGKITMHYKASNSKMDLYFEDDLLVPDFESMNGYYDIRFIQLGGGGISFENSLYDEIYIGVLGETNACGADGPGPNVPGDFNCDGVVDVADLGIIGANFNGNQVTYVDGDANLDAAVDVADLGVVGANWSAAQSGSVGQALQSAGLASLVPEPTTAAVLVVGLGYLGRRRRH